MISHYSDITWVPCHFNHQQLNCSFNRLFRRKQPINIKTLHCCPFVSSICQPAMDSLIKASHVESTSMSWYLHDEWPGDHFKNTYELLNLIALKFSPVTKIQIFQCMAKIFCVEFQRDPLKFHTKYVTQTLKDMIVIQHWNFKSS